MVLFTAMAAGGFSFILATIWKDAPMYEAEAKVQFNTEQGIEGFYAQYLSSSYGIGGDQIETQEAIITSFSVLKKVGGELGWLEEDFTGEDTTRVVLQLQGLIDTEQDGSAAIITIGIEHENPIFARDLANIVAEQYVEYDFEQKNQKALKQRKFAEDKLNEKRGDLKAAEDAVKAYREKADLISLEAQTGVILEQVNEAERRVRTLEQNLNDLATLEEEMKSRRGGAGETIQGASRAQVGDTFAGLAHQLNQLRLEQNGLLIKFTENHPQVKQLQAQLDQLQDDLVSTLQQRIRTLEREKKAEQELLDTLRVEKEQLPAKGLELARLERKASMAQELVVSMEEQYQTVLLNSAHEVRDVVVLQKAITPTPKKLNQPVQRGFMGVALGLIIGIVFAVVAEILPPRRTLSVRFEGCEPEEDEEEGLVTAESRWGISARRFWPWGGSVLLALISLILVWQSGYLTKPLGLIPVSSDYKVSVEAEEAEEGLEEQAVEKAVVRDVKPAVVEAPPKPLSVGAADELQRSGEPPSSSGKRAEAYAIRVASYPPSNKWAIQHLKHLRENDQAAFLVPVEVQNQQWERLMVGGFATWDETFMYAQQLRQKGLIEEFVILRLPYAIELETYRDLELARQAVETLQARGYSTYWQVLPDGSARVLSGAFETDEEARAFLANMPVENRSAQVVRR